MGALGTEIVRFKMSSNSIKPVYKSNQVVSSLNCDIKQSRLMWLEEGQDTIYSYKIQHKVHGNTHILSAKSVLITGLTSVTAFTYDWVTQSIIWCSEVDRTVHITSLDGTQYTLLQLPDSLLPSSVAVDPFRQYVMTAMVPNYSLCIASTGLCI